MEITVAILFIIVVGMWAAGSEETDDKSTHDTKVHICIGYCPHREDEEEEEE